MSLDTQAHGRGLGTHFLDETGTEVQSDIQSVLSREGNHLEDKLVGVTSMIQ